MIKKTQIRTFHKQFTTKSNERDRRHLRQLYCRRNLKPIRIFLLFKGVGTLTAAQKHVDDKKRYDRFMDHNGDGEM